jgi:acyl-CoA dehydrogenase
VSGQKVWISTAQVAEKILLLTTADAGLTLFLHRLRPQHIEVREIDKMGRNAVDSNQVFFDGLPVPEADRIGEEGKGFEYILHGMNPERILIAAELRGPGPLRGERAAKYAASASSSTARSARTRASSTRWRELDGARGGQPDGVKAAWLYDPGKPCGAEANAAKYLAARPASTPASRR